jgi:hypothetical protein
MRIGIDFDNTIAGYDRLFARLAVEAGVLAGSQGGGKRAVRDAVRQSAEGDVAWQRLQAQAYGARMAEAELIDGVADFLHACRAQGIQTFVVSHKTRHAGYDPLQIDLHQAALAWMEAQNFFSDGGFGLRRDHVFFEATRAAKIARIRALGLSHFIDDLEEVFAEPAFPPGVAAILFDPAGPPGAAAALPALRLTHWHEIHQHVFQRRR